MDAIRSEAPHAGAFLALLLATDLLFILAHVDFMVLHLLVWDTPGLLDEIPSDFSIVTERGFAETFQYIKAYWLVVMFVWLVVLEREIRYLAWAATFLYLGIDDLMQIHEEAGNTLATRYNYPELLGQRPRDLGELTGFAIAGAVAVSLLAIAYITSDERFRRASRTLVALVALLVFFGIVADGLHIVFLETWAGALVGLLEDGGELIVLSLTVWYVWRLVGLPRSGRAVPAPAGAVERPDIEGRTGG